MPFKAGDDVRHKSGGPRMTVIEHGTWGMADEEKGYKCRWWDANKNTFTERVFIEEELEPYPAR